MLQDSSQTKRKPRPTAKQLAARFKPGQSGNPMGARLAMERRLAAAEQHAVEVAPEIERLKAELGHAPSPSEALLIEAAASAAVDLRHAKSRAERLTHQRILVRALGRLHPTRPVRHKKQVVIKHPHSFDAIASQVASRDRGTSTHPDPANGPTVAVPVPSKAAAKQSRHSLVKPHRPSLRSAT
jgi:hypothetical protein